MLLSEYRRWFFDDQESVQFVEELVNKIRDMGLYDCLQELEAIITFRASKFLYQKDAEFNLMDDLIDYFDLLIRALRLLD